MLTCPAPPELANLPVLLALRMINPPWTLTSPPSLGGAFGSLQTGPVNDIPKVSEELLFAGDVISKPSPKQQKPFASGVDVPVFVQSSKLTVTLAVKGTLPTCVPSRFPVRTKHSQSPLEESQVAPEQVPGTKSIAEPSPVIVKLSSGVGEAAAAFLPIDDDFALRCAKAARTVAAVG